MGACAECQMDERQFIAELNREMEREWNEEDIQAEQAKRKANCLYAIPCAWPIMCGRCSKKGAAQPVNS